MPQEGQTGVVLPVPAADGLLCAVARNHPGAVREGVPAHLSVLYPFVPAAGLTDRDVAGLAALFDERPAPRISFPQCRRRAGFVYLTPDPVRQVAELTAEARRRWPDLPGTGHIEVGPHLTVAMRTSEATAAEIERRVLAEPRITAELDEAWLVVFGGRCEIAARFPFGGTHGEVGDSAG